ncbi:hypothetical protein JDV02_000646 [Purpureocillium takamizusanense]|uniref:LrgB-like protein n=1 Tax=Purpureocillium takamizusanense TaxID=2060973 RepID=A0A9Q8Q6L0_9HYPO|nr:uncharacterized protein JDV02_000646 [Purpureocillium takamizusanense]UNI13960.1 hypothetical protein JDV02_000646 [Purpureocillium takamizusanense]
MGTWRAQWRKTKRFLAALFLLVVIYLTSQLVVWGFSRLLAPVDLEFFASVLAMVFVFITMTVASYMFPDIDTVYQQHFKAKMNFINANLGIGFSIPISLMKQSDILSGHDIVRVFGTFITTNVTSWIGILLITALIVRVVKTVEEFFASVFGCRRAPRGTAPRPGPPMYLPEPDPGIWMRTYMSPPSPGEWLRSPLYAPASPESPPAPPILSTNAPQRPMKDVFSKNPAIILAFVGILLVGAPIAAATEDERCLDAFVILFLWISSVRFQLFLKKPSVFKSNLKVKNVLVTLMNPVLGTTLLLIAYTRAKAASKDVKVTEVLATLSSDTPLYALWTSQVTHQRLPRNPEGWFGAGDLALSFLECGLFAWGFKLYECRRQVFSTMGMTVSMVCIGAAAANVFLSVGIARSLDLDVPEALSFATRSTTLALSKPAITAVGGNVAINAMIVVSNGILGQLMFPFVVDRLGVQRPPTDLSAREAGIELQDVPQWSRHRGEHELLDAATQDSAMTIAAGVTAGVNSAAMGVSYMYGIRSRAAPYTALSMVVFGIMTVVLTTIEPFKGMVIHMAMA